jgi:hypothetical protein
MANALNNINQDLLDKSARGKALLSPTHDTIDTGFQAVVKSS